MSMFIDPAIRDTVLVPIFVLVVVVTYSRGYLIRLISSPPVPPPEEVAQRATLARAGRLRAHGGYIGPAGFAARKEYFTRPASAEDVAAAAAADARARARAGADGDAAAAEPFKAPARAGRLHPPGLKDANPMAPGTTGPGGAPPSPWAMLEPMKPQFVFMGSQFGVGYLVSNFMTGFITLRLPFGLTERFKAITQAGIAAPGISSSFVSASSWYYILCFGMPPLFRLLSIGSDADAARLMQMQMGMAGAAGGAVGGGPGGPFMAKTAFAGEASALAPAEWLAAASPLVAAEAALLAEARAAGDGERPPARGGAPRALDDGGAGAAPAELGAPGARRRVAAAGGGGGL